MRIFSKVHTELIRRIISTVKSLPCTIARVAAVPWIPSSFQKSKLPRESFKRKRNHEGMDEESKDRCAIYFNAQIQSN